MKTKMINEIHKYYNEPIKSNKGWYMIARFTAIPNILCEKYEDCYEQAKVELNKVINLKL